MLACRSERERIRERNNQIMYIYIKERREMSERDRTCKIVKSQFFI